MTKLHDLTVLYYNYVVLKCLIEGALHKKQKVKVHFYIFAYFLLKFGFREKHPNISIFAKFLGENTTLSVFAKFFKKIIIFLAKQLIIEAAARICSCLTNKHYIELHGI